MVTLADQIKEIVYFVHRYGVQSLIAFGVGLHLYEIFGLGEFGGWTILLLLWSITPYLLCLAMSFWSKNASFIFYPAFVATAIVVAFDLMCHIEVFVSPSSSTSSLILLFMPMWNIFFVIVTYVVFLIGYWLFQWSQNRSKDARKAKK